MIKTLLALTGAVLLAAPVLHAAPARSFGGGYRSGAIAARRPYYAGYRGGNHYRGHGRYYYLGGVPYFYDPFFFGFGYGYGGGYYGDGYGFYGAPYGYGYGNGYGYGDQNGQNGQNGPNGTYEGRITDQNGNRPDMTALPTAVQRQLSKRGYYKGDIDGEFGPASKKALSRFQRDNDLRETGRIDEATIKALGFDDRH